MYIDYKLLAITNITSVEKMVDPERKNKNQKITIQQVAKEAGVSTGTVSRVLNKRPGVKSFTQQRVLEAMKRLNYLPDTAARELSLGKMATIGLNVGAGSRRLIPFFMLFLEHLTTHVQADGFRFREIPTGPHGLPEFLTDGLVLFGAHDDDPRISYLQDRNIPFVLVGRANGVRWVMPDDYDGGLQATRHLIRLGHREILHLSGLMNNQAFHDRYSGYLHALEESGVSPEKEYLLDGEFSSLGAYRAVRKAREGGLEFSAIFAASDEMAIGAIAALEDLGLDVPLDVSVVGFDDLPEIGENLTTIHQDIDRIAETAVILLKEAFEGAPVRHEVIPVQLIARSTTSRRR